MQGSIFHSIFLHSLAWEVHCAFHCPTLTHLQFHFILINPSWAEGHGCPSCEGVWRCFRLFNSILDSDSRREELALSDSCSSHSILCHPVLSQPCPRDCRPNSEVLRWGHQRGERPSWGHRVNESNVLQQAPAHGVPPHLQGSLQTPRSMGDQIPVCGKACVTTLHGKPPSFWAY